MTAQLASLWRSMWRLRTRCDRIGEALWRATRNPGLLEDPKNEGSWNHDEMQDEMPDRKFERRMGAVAVPRPVVDLRRRGNAFGIDIKKITWKRCVDMNNHQKYKSK